MIITISGNPGSGKSTVAKILVKRLGYERVNAGGIMREMSKERGITLEELGKLAKNDFSVDQEIDQRAGEKARAYQKQGKDVLVEGRIQYHFLPESKKVYVWVDPKVGAERILKDLQDKDAAAARNQTIVNSVEEVFKLSEEREEGDASRYIKFYGTDYRKKENYDFVVDTTQITAEQAADKVMGYIQKE
jgi:CMP/dCMP kinase